MLRPTLLTLALLFASSAAVHAQIDAWPQPATIKPGTHLTLGLHSGSLNATPCRLKSLDADHLVCSGHHHASVTYDRADVDMIQRARLALPIGKLFKAGLITALLGDFCGVDGGPICLTPAIIGLTIMAGSVMLFFVEAAHNDKHRFLYIEPPSTAPVMSAN